MALSEQDREWVKAIVAETSRELDEKNREKTLEIAEKMLVSHQEGCPHGKALQCNKMFLAGVIAASSLAGGGGALALAKLIIGM